MHWNLLPLLNKRQQWRWLGAWLQENVFKYSDVNAPVVYTETLIWSVTDCCNWLLMPMISHWSDIDRFDQSLIDVIGHWMLWSVIDHCDQQLICHRSQWSVIDCCDQSDLNLKNVIGLNTCQSTLHEPTNQRLWSLWLIPVADDLIDQLFWARTRTSASWRRPSTLQHPDESRNDSNFCRMTIIHFCTLSRLLWKLPWLPTASLLWAAVTWRHQENVSWTIILPEPDRQNWTLTATVFCRSFQSPESFSNWLLLVWLQDTSVSRTLIWASKSSRSFWRTCRDMRRQDQDRHC